MSSEQFNDNLMTFLQQFKDSMEVKIEDTKVKIEETNKKIDSRLVKIEEEVINVNKKIEEEVYKVNKKIEGNVDKANLASKRMDARLSKLEEAMRNSTSNARMRDALRQKERDLKSQTSGNNHVEEDSVEVIPTSVEGNGRKSCQTEGKETTSPYTSLWAQQMENELAKAAEAAGKKDTRSMRNDNPAVVTQVNQNE